MRILRSGPVIHRIPTRPLSILESAERAFDVLLTGITGDHLLGTPVHAVGQQHGAPQALIEQLRQGGRIEVELQMPMPMSVALFQLIANQLG
jgi:hypothetical protein